MDAGGSSGAAEALASAARALLEQTGDGYFRALVEHAGAALAADLVFVGELAAPGSVRTLATWPPGALGAAHEYPLAGTPCALVVGGGPGAWDDRVRERFPDAGVLARLGAEAYAGTPLPDSKGEPIGLLAAVWSRPRDAAAAREALAPFSARAGAELDRRRSERSHLEAEERLALALDAAELAMWDLTGEGADAPGVVNDRWFTITGHRRSDFPPTPREWLSRVHEEDRPAFEAAFSEHLAGRLPSFDVTYRVRHADGGVRWIRTTGRALPGKGGSPRLVGVHRDVTDKQHLEQELLQARKLEAIGGLAGGIAHDFNNLLTAILTALEFAADALPEDAPERDDLAVGKEAATRASELTRQLLAFARRQHVEPQVLDLNAHVRDAERLLQRTLGEHVRLVTALSSDVAPVRVDPTQLQQVILNLAVNARDAMPRGGVVTIDTAATQVGPRDERHPGLAPGTWVRLCVSDTGEGMDAETAARVFEPFFTTKEGGRGTGLGLATVYGIVTQAGGQVSVQTERGVGSTFKVWLPRAEGADVTAAASREVAEPRGGDETLLLVEDDPLVLSTAARALESAGYDVVRARSGEEALAVVRERPVDLLVCDVVMPRMPGTAVAREVDRLRPGTPILFTSGYTAGAALGVVLRDRGDAFLPKPFTPRALAAKVREVLDRARRPRAAAAGAPAPRG